MLQATAQTPQWSAGDEFLDDVFFDTAESTSARALPSSTVPFFGTLTSIREQSSLEDIQYVATALYTHLIFIVYGSNNSIVFSVVAKLHCPKLGCYLDG